MIQHDTILYSIIMENNMIKWLIKHEIVLKNTRIEKHESDLI